MERRSFLCGLLGIPALAVFGTEFIAHIAHSDPLQSTTLYVQNMPKHAHGICAWDDPVHSKTVNHAGHQRGFYRPDGRLYVYEQDAHGRLYAVEVS